MNKDQLRKLIIYFSVAGVLSLAFYFLFIDDNKEAPEATKTSQDAPEFSEGSGAVEFSNSLEPVPQDPISSSEGEPAESGSEPPSYPKWFLNMPEKVRKQWEDFAKFSPGNQYNPLPPPNQRTEKAVQVRNDYIFDMQSLKSKKKLGRKLTEQEKNQLKAFETKKLQDQNDLLRYAIQKDDSLTEEEKKRMTDLIAENNKKIEETYKDE